MASSWGSSWGNSWGNSWGSIAVAATKNAIKSLGATLQSLGGMVSLRTARPNVALRSNSAAARSNPITLGVRVFSGTVIKTDIEAP